MRPASADRRTLERALYDRSVNGHASPIHHRDRGSQYLAIRYTERLAEAGIEPSVGSVDDSYDNALAETIIGLYKTELIRQRGPWRNLDAVEIATLEWVHWFNVRHERRAQASKTRRSMSARWKGWASLRCRTVLSYSSVRTC